MTSIQIILDRKSELGKERDLCAELYNLWISKLQGCEDDPQKYNTYIRMIENMEPYTQMLKEEIRGLNREICLIEGVDSISETDHKMECVYKYGYDKPK